MSLLHAIVATCRSVYAGARRRIESALYERHVGLETGNVVHLHELGLEAPGRQDYHATPWPLLRRALSLYTVEPDDVLLDLGCGKGRVLVEAAASPYRRIIGVELSDQLAEEARRNIARVLPHVKCRNIEVVVADVETYVVPDDVTVVYLFDPFHGDVFQAALDNLLASLRRRPRELAIIYMDPHEEARLLAAGAKLVDSIHGMRPTKTWANENSVRVYKLIPPPSG